MSDLVKKFPLITHAAGAALAGDMTAAGQGGGIFVPVDDNIGAARVANADGAYMWGPGKIAYTPSSVLGNRVQNPAGRDRLAWGSEYLYKWINKIAAATAATVRISGDSTAAGLGMALGPMLAGFAGITLTTVVNGGQHTGNWVASFLAADVAAAPDLLIWHWGMNDCLGLARTLAQFEASMRAGLTTYRAAVPIGSGGIVLMTPNCSSDGTNGRDEAHFEKMRHIIRTAAEDFQCAFFDTYGYFQDAYNGIGVWLDDTYSDGLRGVHPGLNLANAIAGELLDVVIPRGIRRALGDFGISNAAGMPITLDATADGVTSYPLGISIRRAQVANNWPQEGWVITFRENSNATSCFQILYEFNVDYTPWMRTWSTAAGGTWGWWRPLGVDNVGGKAAPLAGAVSSTYPNGTSIRRATPGNGWPLDGYVITMKADGAQAYCVQIIHQYNVDLPTQMRVWSLAGVWGIWRTLGGTAIGLANRYVGNGSASVVAHIIAAGIRYTYILNNTAAAAYALTLPAAIDGSLLTVVFANATGVITYNVTAPATGQVGLPTPAAANVPLHLIYHSTTLNWMPA